MSIEMHDVAIRAERTCRLTEAHRKTHEAARLIKPEASTVDLGAAENLLRAAADIVERIRRETLTAELKVVAQ